MSIHTHIFIYVYVYKYIYVCMYSRLIEVKGLLSNPASALKNGSRWLPAQYQSLTWPGPKQGLKDSGDLQ